MKLFLFPMTAALLLPLGAAAQERAAGQAYDAQVNWASLKNSIDLVSSQNKALAAMLDKMTACNTKKMVYAPGDGAADADGCVGGGLTLGQELPAAPPCIDAYKRSVPLGTGSLAGGAGNRLVVTYSGSAWFPGRCGSLVTYTFSRTYDGKTFSACSQSSVTTGDTKCGRGEGGP